MMSFTAAITSLIVITGIILAVITVLDIIGNNAYFVAGNRKKFI